MADIIQAASQAVPPHVQLIRMGTAYWASKVVFAAAELGLAAQVAGGPKSAAELAGPMVVHAPSLHRLMRMLASLGLLAERFSLTALGEALKTGAPGSAKAALLTTGSSWCVSAFENIIHSVQTGSTGFEKAQGMPLFDYLARYPEDAPIFSETVVGFQRGAQP
jgi:hypothetical protein